MRHGRHYATFTIGSGGVSLEFLQRAGLAQTAANQLLGDSMLSNAFLGVVGPGFDPTDTLACYMTSPPFGGPAWMLTQGGTLIQGNNTAEWEGQPRQDEVGTGWDWEITEGDEVVRATAPLRCPCAA